MYSDFVPKNNSHLYQKDENYYFRRWHSIDLCWLYISIILLNMVKTTEVRFKNIIGSSSGTCAFIHHYFKYCYHLKIQIQLSFYLHQNRSVLVREWRAQALNRTGIAPFGYSHKALLLSLFRLEEALSEPVRFRWWMFFYMYNWIKLYLYWRKNFKKAGIKHQTMKVLYHII